MRTTFLFLSSVAACLLIAISPLRADQVEMRNGDHYSGRVLSLSADTLALESEVLGKIFVPRKNVSSIAFGNHAPVPKTAALVAPASVPMVLPATAPQAGLSNTNVDLSAALLKLGGNTNFIGQIRQQMLGGSPEAAGKYDELVSGLLSGKMNLNDLRREAKSSADQLRALKSSLGPEAGDTFDVYLEILDNFVKETADEPVGVATPAAPANIQVH